MAKKNHKKPKNDVKSPTPKKPLKKNKPLEPCVLAFYLPLPPWSRVVPLGPQAPPATHAALTPSPIPGPAKKHIETNNPRTSRYHLQSTQTCVLFCPVCPLLVVKLNTKKHMSAPAAGICVWMFEEKDTAKPTHTRNITHKKNPSKRSGKNDVNTFFFRLKITVRKSLRLVVLFGSNTASLCNISFSFFRRSLYGLTSLLSPHQTHSPTSLVFKDSLKKKFKFPKAFHFSHFA